MRALKFLAVALAVIFLGSFPATAQLGNAVVNTTSSLLVTGASGPTNYAGNSIWANAASAPLTITLDTPANFGVGLVSIKKVDMTSNLVTVANACSPTCMEEGQATLPLSLEGDAAIFQSDGISQWKLISPGLYTLRCHPDGAEHDITILYYNIDPTYCGYVMLVDTYTAGGPVEMVLPSITVAAYSHQNWGVTVCMFDSNPTSNFVSVVSQSGQYIAYPSAIWLGTPGASSMKLDITINQKCAKFWTDGARWVVIAMNGL